MLFRSDVLWSANKLVRWGGGTFRRRIEAGKIFLSRREFRYRRPGVGASAGVALIKMVIEIAEPIRSWLPDKMVWCVRQDLNL